MNVPVLDRAKHEAPAVRPAGRARLSEMELVFAAAPDGVTHLARQFAAYPFHVCRPFRYEGDPAGMATVYVQSASGGIYEDERLETRIVAGENAAAHVTTQASTIVHEMRSGRARQKIVLRAAAGSFLEYLSDPLILFPDANLDSELELVVEPGACAIVGDGFLAHDPKAKARMFGRLQSDVRVVAPSGRVLACDRIAIDGPAFRAAMGSADREFATHGSLLMVASPEQARCALDAVRPVLAESPDIYGGASLLPQDAGLWIRMVARDGAAQRRTMIAAWSVLRLSLVGRMPAMRRK
jgi:urease accessory protein